jgi:hypothetical protein
MVFGDGEQGGHAQDWRPIPDPTILTTEQLRRELAALREILTARLDGMDKATQLLDETVNRTPTEIQIQIMHLKELLEARFEAGERLSLTRLDGIERQFAERDVRAVQAADASGTALSAALEATAKSAEKTEQAFTKQIDGIGARLTELKERIDRGEGSTAGASDFRAERRLDIGTILQAIAILATMAGLIIVAFRH